MKLSKQAIALTLLTFSANEQGALGNQFDVQVLIVGAGAAGLSAAHVLEDEGFSYHVLEAHPTEIGGRTRSSHAFGNEFNIDLGAEYIHTTQAIRHGVDTPYDSTGTYTDAYEMLQEMVLHPLEITTYRDDYTIQEPPFVTLLDSRDEERYHNPPEYRWAGGMSWHSFLTEEVAYTEVRQKIINDCEVTDIKWDNIPGVEVRCRNNRSFTAAHVIVTVPMKILQNENIDFQPNLPANYIQAIDEFNIADGFKIWLEFDNQWYPEYSSRDSDYQSFRNSWNIRRYEDGDNAGYRLFWNEMYPYSTNRHIMGGLIYGDKAREYANMSDTQIRDSVLDLISPYLKGATFTGNWELLNWSNEQFIRSAYTIFADDTYQNILYTPLPSLSDPKLLFAGEALNTSWGCVHGAAQTGREQAWRIVGF